MNYQTLTFDLTDGVATITLNRPDVMNALTTQMRAEIAHAVKAGGEDARVVVLTGAGRAFCSGQDLGDRANAADLDLERTLRDEYAPMLRAIIDCPVPTIAAVNGAAAGAGANLALACDVVIASESAYFLQAFTRIGLIPDAGGTYVLPRTMGMAKAMGAALFAEKITAAQADAWGMIWEAIPDDEFDAKWKARAEHLANGPTQAFAAAKRVIRASWGNDLEAQLASEAMEQGQCGQSRDFREGVIAFIEKRKPSFEGR
ncbi:MAG: enoyl-CoA hydratase-related protein [Pseudomonadota bacterium]